MYIHTYPGFAQYNDANLCVEPKKLKTIQCLRCCIVFMIVFFISDELQDVYRCLLIFNLYNGVAGCLWLLSAKELYMILGRILAFLKSLAKLPLISLGPRLNPPESIVYWLFSYCDNFLNEWNVFIFSQCEICSFYLDFSTEPANYNTGGNIRLRECTEFFIDLVLEYA